MSVRIKISDLKKMIQIALYEGRIQNYDQIKLTNGTMTDYGSLEHINDMENSLKSLETLRNQQRRGTAARSTYALSCQQLKSQLKRAQKKQDAQGLDGVLQVSDIEPMSLDEPGKSRVSKPGFGGGSSSSLGHGRFNPGQ